MVITEPPRPSARLLGLSLKLFPSAMERMLNEDLIRFTQTLCRLRQDRGGEKNALLAGFLSLVRLHFFAARFRSTQRQSVH